MTFFELTFPPRFRGLLYIRRLDSGGSALCTTLLHDLVTNSQPLACQRAVCIRFPIELTIDACFLDESPIGFQIDLSTYRIGKGPVLLR